MVNKIHSSYEKFKRIRNETHMPVRITKHNLHEMKKYRKKKLRNKHLDMQPIQIELETLEI